MSERIEESLIHELYIDLWGLTPAWIDAVIKSTLEEADCATGEEAEGYRNPARMAVRFRTLDSARIPVVRSTIQRLLNLANRSSTPAGQGDYVFA